MYEPISGACAETTIFGLRPDIFMGYVDEYKTPHAVILEQLSRGAYFNKKIQLFNG